MKNNMIKTFAGALVLASVIKNRNKLKSLFREFKNREKNEKFYKN